MGKRARLINKQKPGIYPEPENQGPVNSDVADLSKPVTKETIRKKPTKITDNGFTVSTRATKYTEDGMEQETHEPMILDGMNRRVKEEEIQGRCDVCGEYSAQIFHCYVQGCKRTLCPKHVYFFEQDGKQLPYCLVDFKHVVDNFDTWKADAEQRLRKNEKQ
ncbi:MAG: hypothetical protein Q8O13_00245 [Candidatus Omnitrophota bacterium]|nr:hypothetical protein [Candidatus Omnitrophota bacterium]